jgi:Xaa-Pro aminopeptidase
MPIPPTEYSARRERLAAELGASSLILLFAPQRQSHGEPERPFRQEDNLYYLTGIDTPDIVLALLPGEEEHREIVFAPDSDPEREAWSGPATTHEEICRRSGVAEIVSRSHFRGFLQAALHGGPWGDAEAYPSYRPPGFRQFSGAFRQGEATIWLRLGSRPEEDQPLTQELRFAQDLGRRYPEIGFRDVGPPIEALREVKSSAELRRIERAVEITAQALTAAMRRSPEVSHEYQLQATAEFSCRELGASGLGFPTIVAAGEHTTTLHYAANDAPIPPEALVLLDMGAEVSHYTADITRTFPAGGSFSLEQRAIYDSVLAAWSTALHLMRPAQSLRDVHLAAVEALGDRLLALELVSRNEPQQVSLYFMHGIGHPLGLTVHDVMERTRPFEPGMVITLEPGLYVRREAVMASRQYGSLPVAEQRSVAAALERYAGIGVRIEDNVLITEGAPRVLSGGVPRTVEEIEQLMARGE